MQRGTTQSIQSDIRTAEQKMRHHLLITAFDGGMQRSIAREYYVDVCTVTKKGINYGHIASVDGQLEQLVGDTPASEFMLELAGEPVERPSARVLIQKPQSGVPCFRVL